MPFIITFSWESETRDGNQSSTTSFSIDAKEDTCLQPNRTRQGSSI